MKILFYAGAGGHLRELLFILDDLTEGHEYVLITDRQPHTAHLAAPHVHFFDYHGPKPHQILRTLWGSFTGSLRVFLKERPDVVISTGPEPFIPVAIVAKLFGAKVVFIESLCRIEGLSGTGKILYWFADRFLVQWPHLKEKAGKRAEYWGAVV